LLPPAMPSPSAPIIGIDLSRADFYHGHHPEAPRL
jgi:hypothetical protein